MTSAAIGYGADLKRGDGASPEVFATIGEITNLTPPSMTKDTVDATNNSSTDRWREFLSGLKDAGEVSAEVNFVPGNATTTSALNDLNSDAASNYKITFPDATEWTFSAFLTGIELGAPLDDKMTATMTFKLTGKPSFIS